MSAIRSYVLFPLLLGGLVLAEDIGLVLAEGIHGGLSGITLDQAPKNVAELKAMEKRIHAVLEKVQPCTVGVSGGSGVVVSKDGYVLTVAHLARRAGRVVWITFPDGRRFKGKTLGNDEGVDAALVKINGKGEWPFVEMGRSGELKNGQWCLAVGYPVGFAHDKPPAVRIGRVLRRDSNVIITDCTIMGGDSGGPLFDLQGKVIGISSRCDRRLASNLHVPIDAFRDQWSRLADGEDFNSRSDLELLLGALPALDVEDTGAEDADAEGARVGRVTAGSAAEKAGIKAGDVIVTFDGKKIRKFDDLSPILRRKKPGNRDPGNRDPGNRDPGNKVEIEVRRGEEVLKLEVSLGGNSREQRR